MSKNNKTALEKERINALFGENRKLNYNPDEEHSVGCNNGVFVPKVMDMVRIFKGIPFALPPIGERRWKKPVPVPDGDNIYEAYYNGKSPIQTVIDSERSSYYPQSEDCLYLNVWVNDACKDTNKPIMVFIHGGAYGWGGTVDPLYDGLNFIKLHPEVILITIAYRVGLFGFVDLSYLKGGEQFEDAPNLGIYDQIEALRWIQKNGEAFGGDINNVTIFGESAGGGSVSILPLIDEARGLFHRVIAESGSLALTYAKDECKAFTDKLIKASGKDSMNELMKLTTEELAKINEGLNEANNFPMRDGKLIPIDPYEPYLKGKTKDIDMILGTNANELYYWIGELGGLFNYSAGMPVKYKEDISKVKKEDKKFIKDFMRIAKGNKIARITEFYNEIMFRLPAILQAEGHSENNGNVYMYYWKEESKIPLYKACHAVELAYVFYNIDETIYTGEKADEELARTVSNMWVEFAKTGNPSLPDIKWDKYDIKNRKTITFKKDDIKIEEDILKAQREILFPIVKYMINPGYDDIEENMSLLEKTNAAINAVFSSISTLVAERIIK